MITINIDKAKVIAHEKRRLLRSEEFLPFDEIIMKQIPGNDMSAVEIERQRIRDKYADMQVAINAAKTAQELQAILAVV